MHYTFCFWFLLILCIVYTFFSKYFVACILLIRFISFAVLFFFIFVDVVFFVLILFLLHFFVVLFSFSFSLFLFLLLRYFRCFFYKFFRTYVYILFRCFFFVRFDSSSLFHLLNVINCIRFFWMCALFYTFLDSFLNFCCYCYYYSRCCYYYLFVTVSVVQSYCISYLAVTKTIVFAGRHTRSLHLHFAFIQSKFSSLIFYYRNGINAQLNKIFNRLYSPGCLFAILLKQFWNTS